MVQKLVVICARVLNVETCWIGRADICTVVRLVINQELSEIESTTCCALAIGIEKVGKGGAVDEIVGALLGVVVVSVAVCLHVGNVAAVSIIKVTVVR